MKRSYYIFTVILLSVLPSMLYAQHAVKNPGFPFPKEPESKEVELNKEDVFGNGEVFLYDFLYDRLYVQFRGDSTLSSPLKNDDIIYAGPANVSLYPGQDPKIEYRVLENDGTPVLVLYCVDYFPNALEGLVYLICTIDANKGKVDIKVVESTTNEADSE